MRIQKQIIFILIILINFIFISCSNNKNHKLINETKNIENTSLDTEIVSKQKEENFNHKNDLKINLKLKKLIES
jgi:hypothetical protein